MVHLDRYDKHIEKKVVTDWLSTWYEMTDQVIYHKSHPERSYTCESLTKEVVKILNIDDKHYKEVYQYVDEWINKQ